ncbi:hypothetical protein ACA910_019205 [Epithemia clementina (nom. ined.)]
MSTALCRWTVVVVYQASRPWATHRYGLLLGHLFTADTKIAKTRFLTNTFGHLRPNCIAANCSSPFLVILLDQIFPCNVSSLRRQPTVPIEHPQQHEAVATAATNKVPSQAAALWTRRSNDEKPQHHSMQPPLHQQPHRSSAFDDEEESGDDNNNNHHNQACSLVWEDDDTSTLASSVMERRTTLHSPRRTTNQSLMMSSGAAATPTSSQQRQSQRQRQAPPSQLKTPQTTTTSKQQSRRGTTTNFPSPMSVTSQPKTPVMRGGRGGSRTQDALEETIMRLDLHGKETKWLQTMPEAKQQLVVGSVVAHS